MHHQVFRNMQEGLLKMDGLRGHLGSISFFLICKTGGRGTDLDRFDSTLNKQAAMVYLAFPGHGTPSGTEVLLSLLFFCFCQHGRLEHRRFSSI